MSESSTKGLLSRDLPAWVSVVLGILFVGTWVYVRVTSDVSPELKADIEYVRALGQYFEEVEEAYDLGKAGELHASISKLEAALARIMHEAA